MTAARPVRVGLIGCGFYAQNHLNAWNDLQASGADLVAVCDLDAAKAGADLLLQHMIASHVL